MGPESQDPVYGVSDQELAGALDELASLPPPSIDDSDRFVIEVRAILEDRAQGGWAKENPADVAVFLHVDYPKQIGDRLSAIAVSNLLASARPVLGKLFILNRDASWGRAIDLPVDPDSIVDWLIDNDLGERPVIFAYRASQRILVRTNGAKGEITRKEVIRDKPPVATLAQVQAALDLFHHDTLVSPSVCPVGVWEKSRAAEYVPGTRPEKAIQFELRLALSMWFQGILRAVVEESTPVGRIDIRLMQKSDASWTYWAIMELKVLRSSHNAAKGDVAKPVSEESNAKEIAKGIRQAHSFARHWSAIPLLEIFDLRKDKTSDILKNVIVTRAFARFSPAPATRIWCLYGTADEARLAGY
jgi:hypothetical protein